jgi:DNA-binding NarL/FixJ family response regulator
LQQNIVIIEDNPHYRHGLETLFSHASGFRLVRVFGSAQAALDELEKTLRSGHQVDWHLVLMDLELPGIGGIDAIRKLKDKVPSVSVVVLTVFEEPATILEAITAGADGYLLKRTSAPELLAQLETIGAGGAPLTADVARSVLTLLRTQTSPLRGLSTKSPTRLDLTEREQEVLQCLVRGLSYKQVADQLGISLDTVRTHIRGVYKKLQVHTVAEAVSKAIREKLV